MRQRPCPPSMVPSSTSIRVAPTVSGAIRRRFTVPVWLAGL
ncbi:hypothetical protein [Teichococcus aestuarii]